jgi:GT2 family glycosyltransferase
MADKTNLSVVILNFNTGNFLVECLKSLSEAKNEANFDILVVDNNSVDNSLNQAQKLFPEAHYILSKENLGFAKGNNLALRQVKNDYVLILNPDTKIMPGAISTVLSFLETHPEVGAASCKVELANGLIDWASHRGFPTPWASFLYYFLKNDSLYHMTGRNFNKTHEVDVITGAFFMTRKAVLEKVGLFDEDYFMYAEDIDICYRIKEAGFKIFYLPEVKIIHYKGISSGIKKHSAEITTADIEAKLRSVNAFYSTMITFYHKHLASKYPSFINWLVYSGVNFKWSLAKRKLKV